jgi:hypothetical protein
MLYQSFHTTPRRRNARGLRIVSPDRAGAIRVARVLYGRDSRGVEACGVACTFCEDRTMVSAREWTDMPAGTPATCPRCGQ